MTDTVSQTLTQKERYWLDHIQQAQTRNQSLTEYAEAYSLNLKCFYNYRSKLRKKGFLEPKPSNPFVKATVSVAGGLNNTLILLPNGIRIEMQCPADALLNIIKRLAS
jgi:hypothetical protein